MEFLVVVSRIGNGKNASRLIEVVTILEHELTAQTTAAR